MANERRKFVMDMPVTLERPPIGGEINGPGKAYFDHIVTDNMMDALVELAAEVWTVKDRLYVLDKVLAEQGIDSGALIEAWTPDAAAKAERKAQRDAFIGQVFASFSRRTA